MLSMVLTIQDALIQDWEVLFQIETECFKTEAFTRQQIARLMADYNTVCLVARESAKIVGFIMGRASFEGDVLTGHILTIDVLPTCRQRGIGAKLLHEIETIFKEKDAKKCYLEVREDNTKALSLYQKSGYKKVGKLRNYYRGAHGLRLRKDL